MATNEPEVLAYYHTNKERPEHRGISLHHDASCTSALTNTEPLIRLSDYEALQAEYDRLTSYYKNGIECFANPCESHSGEKTPPFSEFFEKYGGRCLICVVDNNKALQAENERLVETLKTVYNFAALHRPECADESHNIYRAVTMALTVSNQAKGISRGE